AHRAAVCRPAAIRPGGAAHRARAWRTGGAGDTGTAPRTRAAAGPVVRRTCGDLGGPPGRCVRSSPRCRPWGRVHGGCGVPRRASAPLVVGGGTATGCRGGTLSALRARLPSIPFIGRIRCIPEEFAKGECHGLG